MTDFIIAGLATWRLSNMLVNEYGPFGIFAHVRGRTGITQDASGVPVVWPSNHVLACVWCTSVWIAPFMLLLPRWFVRTLAISSAAIIISEWGQRK